MNSTGNSRVGAGTIFRTASEADPSWRDRAGEQEQFEHKQMVQRLADVMAAAEVRAENGGAEVARGGDAENLRPLKTFSLAEFDGKTIPERKWIVQGLIPDRNVTDLSGDGGLGKSLLALQLGFAVAMGGAWLGHKANLGGVLYFSAEDEADEIHRRAATIAEREGLSLAELVYFHFADLTRELGTELVKIAASDRQSLETTDLFVRLEASIAFRRPAVVILDTRADVYGGNEIDRGQVRTFIRRLRELCLSYDMAILLLSHPSRTGLTTGDGQSGSTAWGNSVRSRLYLKRHPDDPDLRVLTSEKSNYGPAATEMTLRWENGVFRRVDTLVGGKVPDREALERHVEERFMQHLADADLRGEYVNGNKTGQRYAPRWFAKLDASATNRIGEKQYETAMWRLRRGGRLAIVKTDGPPAKRYDRFVAADPMAGLKSLAERQGGTA